MRIPTVFVLLCAAALAEDPAEIFRRAVARQGDLRFKQIKSVNLEFNGHAVLEKTEQAVYREYWYTAADRSFRQITQGKASSKARTERGVDGAGHWSLSGKTRVKLSGGNKDHRALIAAIDEDREEFERILKLVLLTRLEGSKITLAKNGPVKIVDDMPYSARSILGKDRQKSEYWVLRVERKGRAPLLLYVKTTDYTVRKAVQLPLNPKKDKPLFYYFAYTPDGKMPAYFSVHSSLPTDKQTRKSSGLARGEIAVRLARVKG